MTIRNKCLIGLVALGILDMVFPIPILAFVLIYVILQRPPWFKQVVSQVYQ